MGPQSDFKESINEGKQMEQRRLPAHRSEMPNPTTRRAILQRPTALEVLFVLKMEGTHSRACRNQAPVQEPVLVEDSGVAKSPLVPLRGGEEHLGEDSSALTGKGKSPRTETLQSTSIKT